MSQLSFLQLTGHEEIKSEELGFPPFLEDAEPVPGICNQDVTCDSHACAVAS